MRDYILSTVNTEKHFLRFIQITVGAEITQSHSNSDKREKKRRIWKAGGKVKKWKKMNMLDKK